MSICSDGDDVIAQASEAVVAAGSPISGDPAACAGDDDAEVRAMTVVPGEKGKEVSAIMKFPRSEGFSLT